MQGLADAIKYMYQQWILRDVVAYVTPGTMVTLCVLRLFFDSYADMGRSISQLPSIAYVPIYGLLFMVGLSIQNFGEVIKLLADSLHRVPQGTRGWTHDEEWIRFRTLLKFHAIASSKSEYGQELQRTRERIEVKKYASGNLALAALICGALIFFEQRVPQSGRWPAVFVILILICFSWRAHRTELRYLAIWHRESLRAAESRTETVPPVSGNLSISFGGASRHTPQSEGGDSDT